MLWVYLLISQIVLVNLLIAMMGNTFSEVKEHAGTPAACCACRIHADALAETLM